MNTKTDKGIAPIPGKGKPIVYECLDCKETFFARKNFLLPLFNLTPKCPHCGSKNVRKSNKPILF